MNDMNESTGPSREAVAHWLATTEERVTSLQQEMEPLARELESLQEQRSLLRDLARTMETDYERQMRDESHIRKFRRFDTDFVTIVAFKMDFIFVLFLYDTGGIHQLLVRNPVFVLEFITHFFCVVVVGGS